MRKFISDLNNLRLKSPALRRGRQVELFADRDVYAICRIHPEEEYVIVLNCSDFPQTRLVALTEGRAAGHLKDSFSGREYTVSGGALSVTLEPKTALVLRREKWWAGENDIIVSLVSSA